MNHGNPSGRIPLHARGPTKGQTRDAARDLLLQAALDFTAACERGERNPVGLEVAATRYTAAHRDHSRARSVCELCGAHSNGAPLCPRCDLRIAEETGS